MGCCLHGLRSGSDPTVFSWYTVCCTECSPSQYRIRISCKTRQPACTTDQVSFHFFPVKIGIVAVYKGTLDITINLSKPEKDPKAIAAARNASVSAYPNPCSHRYVHQPRLFHQRFQEHEASSNAKVSTRDAI